MYDVWVSAPVGKAREARRYFDMAVDTFVRRHRAAEARAGRSRVSDPEWAVEPEALGAVGWMHE